MQLRSACEEGMRTWWEPMWDGGEWEHRRGPGCGLGMSQARASQRRRKVEMDFLEDYLMSARLLWKKKGEGNRSNVLTTLVWKMWSAGHRVWWPGMVTGWLCSKLGTRPLVSNATCPRKGLCRNKTPETQPLSPLLQSVHPPRLSHLPFCTSYHIPDLQTLEPNKPPGSHHLLDIAEKRRTVNKAELS